LTRSVALTGLEKFLHKAPCDPVVLAREFPISAGRESVEYLQIMKLISEGCKPLEFTLPVVIKTCFSQLWLQPILHSLYCLVFAARDLCWDWAKVTPYSDLWCLCSYIM